MTPAALIVIAWPQAAEMLAALKAAAPSVTTSLDLGMTRVTLPLAQGMIELPGNLRMDADYLQAVGDDPNSCRRVQTDGRCKVAAFYEETGR